MSALSPTLVADIGEHVGGSTIIDLTVDHAGRWLALVEDRPGTWRDGGFTRTHSKKGRPLRILGPDLEITLPDERQNPHYLRPLDADRWLLVGARCAYRGGDPDRNARVIDADGAVRAEWVFGDGINDVLTARGGPIVVTYFDEGIFGNYGWSEPMGWPGVLRFDRDDGRKLDHIHPPAGTREPADVYAANIVSADEAWFCWYTDFPLVRLDANGARGWQLGRPLRALAVDHDAVWGMGSYDKAHELYHIDIGPLWDPKADTAQVIDTHTLSLPGGEELRRARAFGRGPMLYIWPGGPRLYGLDTRAI